MEDLGDLTQGMGELSMMERLPDLPPEEMVPLAVRPGDKRQRSGKPIQLHANFFRLDMSHLAETAYHHDVCSPLPLVPFFCSAVLGTLCSRA